MDISALNDDDLLGLKDFAKRLEKFIDTEHDFVEGGLVVALSSKFGSGKSTFLKMWKSSLEEPESRTKRMIIPLNAWESDYSGDPLFSIISALAETLKNSNQNTNRLIEAAKDVGWFTTAIASQFVSHFTGINPVVAGETASKKKAEREDSIISMDAFTIHERRKAAMKSLKHAISEIVSSDNPKVLFLVDELDRCRPDYAITYLETIKHLFDIKGAVFILAADRQQLESSAKTAFGLDLDFEEYYRKFVHREVMLPPIQEKGYSKLAYKYVNDYLVRQGSRFCYMKLDSGRINDIAEIIAKLKLTPRQIQEVFRILGHILETTEKNAGTIYSNLALGSIAMAAFKVGAPEVFRLLGTGQMNSTEAIQYLRSIKFEDPEWWFALLFTGGGLEVDEEIDYETLNSHIGAGLTFSNQDVRTMKSDWGHRSPGSKRIIEIHDKIQHIAQWN